MKEIIQAIWKLLSRVYERLRPLTRDEAHQAELDARVKDHERNVRAIEQYYKQRKEMDKTLEEGKSDDD
jgi:hypothetical protein